jgi:hypothetical protein
LKTGLCRLLSYAKPATGHPYHTKQATAELPVVPITAIATAARAEATLIQQKWSIPVVRTTSQRWMILVVANVAGWCMLCLHQSTGAAPAKETGPFANAVEQRFEMINQLREINAQLKEQNALLRSGNLKVVVQAPARP